jgi:sodium pump decarboxylase gamma subunit
MVESILLSTGSENFIQGLGITLGGILIVFLVLILISFILYGFGKAFYKKPEQKTAPAPVPEKAAPVVETPVQEETEGSEEELIAAITAAISCMLEAGGGTGHEGGFVVRSFRRIGRKNGR